MGLKPMAGLPMNKCLNMFSLIRLDFEDQQYLMD
jgi:hypothetical protein